MVLFHSYVKLPEGKIQPSFKVGGLQFRLGGWWTPGSSRSDPGGCKVLPSSGAMEPRATATSDGDGLGRAVQG